MSAVDELKSSPLVSFEEITKALEKFNPTEDGKVPYKQLKIVMRDLGLDPRESEVTKYIDILKSIGKGENRLSETIWIHYYLDNWLILAHFTAESLFELLSNRRNKDSSLEEIRTAFKLFDVKGKGYITADDLKHITEELKDDVKPEELEVNLVILSIINNNHNYRKWLKSLEIRFREKYLSKNS